MRPGRNFNTISVSTSSIYRREPKFMLTVDVASNRTGYQETLELDWRKNAFVQRRTGIRQEIERRPPRNTMTTISDHKQERTNTPSITIQMTKTAKPCTGIHKPTAKSKTSSIQAIGNKVSMDQTELSNTAHDNQSLLQIMYQPATLP